MIPEAAMDSIGRPRPPRAGIVTADHIRKFVSAVDDGNPIYRDSAAAKHAGYRDIVAPPLFAAAVTRPIPERGDILPDGQFSSIAPPGMEHFQTVLAGQTWEFCRLVHPGEILTETAALKSLSLKQGRQGPLVLAETEATICAGDEVVERSVLTLALRDLSGLETAKTLANDRVRPSVYGPPTEYRGDTLIKRPDIISAFLFCAATWAAHRIHYDHDYARSEGFPTAIVPGWMLASYLAELAQARAPEGRRLVSLAVRYHGNAMLGGALACSAVVGDVAHGLDLRIFNEKGDALVTAKSMFEEFLPKQ